MIDLAAKSIWQRKTRSALTVLGVGLAVMLYVYLSTIMSFYDRDLQRTVSGLAGKVIVQDRSEQPVRFPPTSSLIPMAQADAVLKLSGVDPSRSSAVLIEPLVANPAPSMPPQVMAVGLTPGHESAFQGDVETQGRNSLETPDQVILGAGAAEHYDKHAGDMVTIRGHDLRVIGVMQEENELVDSAVLMPLETAQLLFARQGVVSAVMLTARDIDDVQELAEGIQAANPRLVASTPSDIALSGNQILQPQRAFFATVRGTLLAVGVSVVMVVMVMAVSERRREIGTLKALGAGRRHIFSLVLSEAVTLSLTAGLGAILLVWLLTRGDSMPVDGRLALQTVGVAVVVGGLAALWPAWQAQRVDPIESLRHE